MSGQAPFRKKMYRAMMIFKSLIIKDRANQKKGVSPFANGEGMITP